MTMPTLKDSLEGKPVRSPLHPALVHIPIALFPLSSILDVASHLFTSPETRLVYAAFICLIAGIASALFAAIFGIVDYTDIRDDHPAKKTATAHMALNLVAVGLYAGSAGLRFDAFDASATPTLPLVLSLVALAVLGYSGYLGGSLVYDHGIGVGRHRRKTRLPERTITLRSPAQPVAVADDGALGEGETLRVDIDGLVMAVARLDGAVYAFQEFCTHRYAPLSEGKLSGCEVTCPWHRSRFDVRTGEPTQGPAKVPLRTFRTDVRDGKIWVWTEGAGA